VTTNGKSINNRAYALDALRGFAILGMVLSSTIASGILPGWMYHFQEPPPQNIYNASLTGLTWVDLVFPFFLFSMGAAFPFSVKKRFERGETKMRLVFDAVKRGLRLVFFAIFIQHFYPYVLDNPQNYRSWLLAILCFIVLFPMFMRIPLDMPKWAHILIKVGAYIVAIIMLLMTKHADGSTLNIHNSNIIILLLANMAIFATLIYIFTMNAPLKRLAFLLLWMGFMLSATVAGSWVKCIYDFSAISWLFKFDYLKYFFIVIPGAFAGEALQTWMSNRAQTVDVEDNSHLRRQSIIFLILTPTLIIVNLAGLYTHSYVINLVATLVLLIIGNLLINNTFGIGLLWKKLFKYGSYLLILGLLLESFQGGIKKDPATFSYFFVTSGLAFMALIFFSILCDYYKYLQGTRFLVMSGQNPMVAYVADDLLIMPLLNIVGLLPLIFKLCSSNAWLGFMQGLFLTLLTILVTMFFTKIKWFWRT
jgi:predicted acyltransferase